MPSTRWWERDTPRLPPTTLKVRRPCSANDTNQQGVLSGGSSWPQFWEDPMNGEASNLQVVGHVDIASAVKAGAVCPRITDLRMSRGRASDDRTSRQL